MNISRYVTAACVGFLAWAIISTSLLCNKPTGTPYASTPDTITRTDTFIQYVRIYEQSPDTTTAHQVATPGGDSTLRTVATWSVPLGIIRVAAFGCTPDSFTLDADIRVPEYHHSTTITRERQSVDLVCMVGPGIAAAGISAPVRRSRIGIAYNFQGKSIIGQVNIPLYTKRSRQAPGR